MVWTSKVLYDTPGVDGDAFVNRGRAMMLLLGIALGALIARWSYQLGGPVAAIVATAIYCLDPNFIAHAPLVKGDIAFGLYLLGLAYVVWLMGQRATWGRLFWRASSAAWPGERNTRDLSLVRFWPCCWSAGQYPVPLAGNVASTARDPAESAGMRDLRIIAALCCFVITWAGYGFRFGPARSPSVRMDMQSIFQRARIGNHGRVRKTGPPAEIAASCPQPDMPIRGLGGSRHHFLPEPMLAGLLYQHTCVTLWPAFLNGELYGNGRWYYFPEAMIYKTPVSELISLRSCNSCACACRDCVRRHTWTCLCLSFPYRFRCGCIDDAPEHRLPQRAAAFAIRADCLRSCGGDLLAESAAHHGSHCCDPDRRTRG